MLCFSSSVFTSITSMGRTTKNNKRHRISFPVRNSESSRSVVGVGMSDESCSTWCRGFLRCPIEPWIMPPAFSKCLGRTGSVASQELIGAGSIGYQAFEADLQWPPCPNRTPAPGALKLPECYPNATRKSPLSFNSFNNRTANVDEMLFHAHVFFFMKFWCLYIYINSHVVQYRSIEIEMPF